MSHPPLSPISYLSTVNIKVSMPEMIFKKKKEGSLSKGLQFGVRDGKLVCA